jgi:hypothetical protein
MCVYAFSERVMEEHSAAETKSQLEETVQDLGQLIDHIGRFADWWTSVRFTIISLQSTLPKLIDNSNSLRTASVRSRWSTVQQQYLLYSRRVRKSFPSALQI